MDRLEEGEPDTAEIREYLKEKYGQDAVPYVFISEFAPILRVFFSGTPPVLNHGSGADREFIGGSSFLFSASYRYHFGVCAHEGCVLSIGSDTLHSIHEEGKLHEMLQDA